MVMNNIPSEEEIKEFAKQHNIPGQGLADYLSRIDELLIANLMMQRQVLSAAGFIIPVAGVKGMTLNELQKALESGEFVPYTIRQYSMTSARDKEPLEVEGDVLAVAVSAGGTLEGVTVRFNKQDSDAVPMQFFNPWRQAFFKLFITHTAQSGRTLYLAIGRSDACKPESNLSIAEVKNLVSPVVDYTTTVLGDGATYTGDAFNCSENGKIIGSCYSDHAGTLYVDQRNDGTNWDIRDELPYAAADLLGFEIDVLAPEARVVFVNDAGAAQTAFRLYVRMRRV